ncbi:MAG TPA: Bax inhibitor-1/YccA family protein [Anaeromyxobacteraceae bacterium]|nr:Bax inhibitor-1/YccA family protein [Anaeromyxobacteraceae bacterium]
MEYGNAQVLVRGAADVERRFMAAVYRWMTLGLLVTAGVAWYVASTPAALQLVFGTRFVFWGLVLAQFGLVIALSAAVTRLSAGAAGGLFLLYSALNGVTLSVVLLAYTGASVATAFAVTAGTFGAMSVYGTVTRRDLSSWSTFLFMGLIGVVIASVVNVFTKSDMVSWVISAAAVVVFTGLTAYDTQKLRRMAAAGAQVAALPVNGALALYLDFVNLFLALLRIFGGRRD